MLMGLLAIAGREIREGSRNHWIVASTLLLATLSLTIALLGSAPTGTVKANALDIVVVSLSSLTTLLVPLISLLLAHDAIVGEQERGTLLLLLSYPVARSQVLIGKFIGHLSLLCFATLIGYSAAALAVTARGDFTPQESWHSFSVMVGSSILLGAVFISIGYAISVHVASRGAAVIAAVGVWLLFVLLYDMALLGILVLDQGRHIGPMGFNVLLLLNPNDAYRVLNLTAFADVRLLSGMAGMSAGAQLHPSFLIADLSVWVVIPLLVARVKFERKEL